MKYDDASWHYGGEFPEGLPERSGGIHIGMFLAWCLLNDLGGEFHLEESADELKLLRSRAITGTQFLFSACDEKFTDEDLNEIGNAFASDYFNGPDGYGAYLTDYTEALGIDEQDL